MQIPDKVLNATYVTDGGWNNKLLKKNAFSFGRL